MDVTSVKYPFVEATLLALHDKESVAGRPLKVTKATRAGTNVRVWPNILDPDSEVAQLLVEIEYMATGQTFLKNQAVI